VSAAIGVLALQGDFAAHVRAFAAIDVRAAEVRRVRELDALDGLVLPGGESTALLRLMDGEDWLPALARFHARGGALLGTCAGAILLAREVRPAQPSVGVLDVTIARNAYGRQSQSFTADLGGGHGRGVFIRAPRFVRVGPGVEVLAPWDGEPVLVRQGRVLAATFHPELTGETGLHRMFTALAGALREDACASRS
jgi:5'-phosphate synthase pdxT subunit